jgi:hypothetical protein
MGIKGTEITKEAAGRVLADDTLTSRYLLDSSPSARPAARPQA